MSLFHLIISKKYITSHFSVGPNEGGPVEVKHLTSCIFSFSEYKSPLIFVLESLLHLHVLSPNLF